MQRKNLFIVLFLAVVALYGCGKANHPITDITPPETVADLFQTEQTVPLEETQPDSTSETMQKPRPGKPFENAAIIKGITSWGYASNALQDDMGVLLHYQGGEAEIPLELGIQSLEEEGVGIWLFVDGNSQPFHTNTDSELSYCKTIRPSELIGNSITLFFTPQSGKEGDTLEFFYLLKALPEETISTEKKNNFVWAEFQRGQVSRMIMEADSQSEVLLESEDRLLDYIVENIPVASSEVAGWTPEELQQQVETRFFFDEKSGAVSKWNFNKSSLSFKVEIYGAEDAQYGLTLFINNQPVNTGEEIAIALENGIKTVIEGQIDVSDLEEFSAFAVLSPKVYRESGWDDSFVSDIGFFSTKEDPKK